MATKSIGFRVDENELKLILSEMVLTGEKEVGNHVKRVYFDSITGDNISGVKDKIDDLYVFTQYIRQAVDAQDNDLVITMLSGIYFMLREMSNKEVKKEIDGYIDIEAIENYLKKED